MKKNRLVIIETPYTGDVEANIKYARTCMRDSLLRGEYPFASHLLYTQKGILNDDKKKERKIGMQAGFEWGKFADVTIVYTDLGISEGMKRGIEEARKAGRPVEYRKLDKWSC